MWQHQASVLSKSQGVLLMMRGTAECNARKTVGTESTLRGMPLVPMR